MRATSCCTHYEDRRPLDDCHHRRNVEAGDRDHVGQPAQDAHLLWVDPDLFLCLASAVSSGVISPSSQPPPGKETCPLWLST